MSKVQSFTGTKMQWKSVQINCALLAVTTSLLPLRTILRRGSGDGCSVQWSGHSNTCEAVDRKCGLICTLTHHLGWFHLNFTSLYGILNQTYLQHFSLSLFFLDTILDLNNCLCRSLRVTDADMMRNHLSLCIAKASVTLFKQQKWIRLHLVSRLKVYLPIYKKAKTGPTSVRFSSFSVAHAYSKTFWHF